MSVINNVINNNYPPGLVFTQVSGSADDYPAAWPGVLLGNPATNTQSSGDASSFATQQVFMPFYVPFTFTAAKFYISVQALAASSSINVGLYSNTTSGIAQPTGAASSVLNIATTATGTVTTAWTPTLMGNTVYWLGFQASTATTVSLVSYTTNPNINVGPGCAMRFQTSGASTEGTVLWYKANVFSAGSMPNATSISSTVIVKSWPTFCFGAT
jgi:hypothetical protein